MMIFVTFVIFAGALAVSLYAMIATIVPAADQIRRALAGEPQRPFAPLAQLVLAEQRIAIRRWATIPARSVVEWRAAA